MSIGTIITSTEQAETLLPWAYLFAEADKDRRLLVVCPAKVDGLREAVERVVDTIRERDKANIATKHDRDQEIVELVMLELREEPQAELSTKTLEAAYRGDFSLLVVGKHASARSGDWRSAFAREMFHRAPCDVILLRPGDNPISELQRLLVPTAGGKHAAAALRWTSKLASFHKAELQPLYVEAIAGEDSEEVGRETLDEAIVASEISTADYIKPLVVLSDDVSSAVSAQAEKGYDLVLTGMSDSRGIRKALFGSVPEYLLGSPHGFAVGVCRAKKPVVRLLRRQIEYVFDLAVPQMSRRERVSLSRRLEARSRWNFDFLALMILSTAIAALGLIQGNVAVVIGAMLVAPLMTPLLGAGLSIVQGNFPLMRQAAVAIFYAFLTALAVGAVVGLLVPEFSPSGELLSRGRPSVLDMAIAYISGLAAAFAMSRPGLSAALPGVAISAALVPPIATIGVAAALQHASLMRGASLLFATNVVCVILGASFAFFAGGIRPKSDFSPHERWMRGILILLIVCAASLAIPLSSALFAVLQGR